VPQVRKDGTTPARGLLPPGDVSGLRDGHDPATLTDAHPWISAVNPEGFMAAPEETTMRIIFASGEGGTGKTILATKLATFPADRDDNEATCLD